MEDFDKGGKEGQSEEEVPMNTVFGHMFGIVEAFDTVESY